MQKQVVFKMPLELFKSAKVKAVQKDQNMTQYIVSLIEKDLKPDKDKKAD